MPHSLGTQGLLFFYVYLTTLYYGTETKDLVLFGKLFGRSNRHTRLLCCISQNSFNNESDVNKQDSNQLYPHQPIAPTLLRQKTDDHIEVTRESSLFFSQNER
jgi:hypothetical protein